MKPPNVALFIDILSNRIRPQSEHFLNEYAPVYIYIKKAKICFDLLQHIAYLTVISIP